MSDLAFALLLALGGGILAAHCSLMTWREVRTGMAKAQYADYRRSHHPLFFWIIIAANAFAAFLGAVFLTAGLLLLIVVTR